MPLWQSPYGSWLGPRIWSSTGLASSVSLRSVRFTQFGVLYLPKPMQFTIRSFMELGSYIYISLNQYKIKLFFSFSSLPATRNTELRCLQDSHHWHAPPNQHPQTLHLLFLVQLLLQTTKNQMHKTIIYAMAAPYLYSNCDAVNQKNID